MRSRARPRIESAPDFVIAGTTVAPGSIEDVEFEVARLPTRTRLTLPVRVVNGRRPGPSLWISAAIHGDELNGIEIARQVLDRIKPNVLRGVVLVAPIVNLHGFLAQSRYLPDGRDLNRSFPGSSRGSLAARLAHLFMREIVARCEYGIDLHTATNHRTNLPQVRADLTDPVVRELALAFGAPVALHARLRDGSLREAATTQGTRMLLFEGGEAQRFDEDVVAAGVRGVRRVLAHLGMTANRKPSPRPCVVAWSSRWIRAPRSGLMRTSVQVGKKVSKGDVIARITNPFGEKAVKVKAPRDGLVIGRTLNPVVHQGDAILHVTFEPTVGRVEMRGEE
ncbi:MAG: succinylglutamate desuccinylase/aspartoacylase family protein [Planctomycetes bacterium]|nr:succinylglutamate desuccinylase/aspartoacylase family protein [Planctomycetota bacterium]